MHDIENSLNVPQHSGELHQRPGRPPQAPAFLGAAFAAAAASCSACFLASTSAFAACWVEP